MAADFRIYLFLALIFSAFACGKTKSLNLGNDEDSDDKRNSAHHSADYTSSSATSPTLGGGGANNLFSSDLEVNSGDEDKLYLRVKKYNSFVSGDDRTFALSLWLEGMEAESSDNVQDALNASYCFATAEGKSSCEYRSLGSIFLGENLSDEGTLGYVGYVELPLKVDQFVDGKLAYIKVDYCENDCINATLSFKADDGTVISDSKNSALKLKSKKLSGG